MGSFNIIPPAGPASPFEKSFNPPVRLRMLVPPVNLRPYILSPLRKLLFFVAAVYDRRGWPAMATVFGAHRAPLPGVGRGLILLALLAPGPARLAAAEAPFLVDDWGTADGLPQSSVIALTQTRDGYLWLGTLNGLVRFDGHAFTRFNVNNTPGLPGNGIIFLFEDRHTNLWAGTDLGALCRIRNGVAQPVEVDGAGGKIIFAEEGADGVIWFCTAEGKFFSATDGRVDPHPARFPAELYYRVFHLHVPGKNGVTWRLQNGRVGKYRGESLLQDFGACPWTASQVTALYKSPDGHFIQIPFDARITAAAEDREGNLVVGTHGEGIFWFTAAGGCRRINTDQGLSYGTVLSLCFDREGNLWAGTDGDGLERIGRQLFDTPAGLGGGVAQSLAEDERGLWVAFNSRGVTYAETNTTKDFHVGSRNNALSVLADRRQQVWVGTRDEGLFRLADGGFQPVAGAKVPAPISALFQSRDGKVWAGGKSGLASFDGREWQSFALGAGLPATDVRALAEDARGNLWIGTGGGGLFTLSGGKLSPVDAPVKDISCLLIDREDVLWAGTSGHGLARLAQGRWTRCGAADGLAGDDIGYLLDDGQGNLWIGSYEGLLRVEKRSLAEFADQGHKVSGRLFLTRECSAGAQPAPLRMRNDQLCFPTIEGVVLVHPEELKLNTNLPPVVIEAVLVDGVRQRQNPLGSAGPAAVTLAPENEQLEVHFTCLNFSAPKHAQAGVRFKYALVRAGHEASWTDIGGERVAHFPKLPPGAYRFQVVACNEDGVWNQAGASLAVTVEPPFWRRPSFLAVTVLFLLGALAGTIYLISTAKLKRQLRAARQKELIEKERARIARDLHDQLGANLTQVTLLGEMAEADKDLPAEVELHAQQICATARETTRSLDEIVWAVNPSNDTLEGLANYACKYAQDYFALAGISFRSELPTQLPPTPILPEVRHNVFLAFKEAVNNVVKHAQASEAHVSLELAPGRFSLSVTDNGRGLGDLSGKQLRNGLKNMRKRLADVHGEFDIAPGAAGGTVVRLTVPVAAG